MHLSVETVVIGALTGLTYGVLGAGLVLIYRATKVINFAHGEIGAFGAALLAKLVLDLHWNYFVAFGAMLVVGGAIGAVIELLVVRRLFRAPRLVLLVATIGVSQLLFVAQLKLPGVHHQARYPSPINGTLRVGNLLLTSPHLMVLLFIPATVIALAFFLNRTPAGLAIRASADNADRAELVGISTKRVSTMVWVVAAVLSTLTAILINPVRGTIVGLPSQALGPSLLLRALAAGLVGGLVSLPLTLVGGVLIGVVEAVIFVNSSNPGVADVVLFVLVLVLVLLRARGAIEESSSWSFSPKVKAVPERLRAVWWVPRLNVLAGVAGLAVAIALPLVFATASQAFLLSRVALFAVVALSVTVLTGWAGQLSLGQFAFVGLGSFTTYALHARGMPFAVAVAYATVGGVIAALLIGFPALRVRGLFLAVTTLAFAVATRSWILTRDVFVGHSATVYLPRGTFAGIDFHSQRTYYYLCLAVLVATTLVVAHLRKTGIGRTIIATRDNEPAAASFTVSPTVAKLTAFAVAGGLAALAGGLLAGLRVQFGADAFGPELSLLIVATTIIGGIGSVGGALIGAAYVIGLPAIWGNNATVALFTSGIGLLLLLLYLPGGLIQVVHRARDMLLAIAERRLGAASSEPATERPRRRRDITPDTAADVSASATDAAVVLAASEVTVRFGGRLALDCVSVTAASGETVGLIGSNGAGKSTLMNVISGFIRPVSGTVTICGVDATGLAPHERASLGVGRVFQDARLFGDLTVRETVEVALEAHEHSELVPSMLALPPSRRAERRKVQEAAEYIDFLGLGQYADTFLSDLSTGTRRIVEMCCLLAQESRVLLLDEPTAGVAQRETEAFGPLILDIRQELDATILVIEHDIPLVMSISDRVYCFAAGACIAEGPPEEVQGDPAVVAAYLGTDERAIARSGAVAVALEGAK